MLHVFVTTGLLIFGCLNVILGSTSSDWESFDGYQLIRAFAENFDQAMALADLQKSDSTLDFWTEPCVNGNTDILVPPEKLTSILQFLGNQGIKNSITIEDVGKVITSQMRVKEAGVMAEMTWDDYQDLETIYAWCDSLSQNNPYVEVVDIGQSYEGRKVKVVKISKNSTAGNPAMFIDSTIHAREWITLATITFMINQLVNNPDDQALLDDVDFYFLLAINPDGYAYTRSANRMWRKTRSMQQGNCYGVDGNRNFDYKWNSCSGCSSGSCGSDVFRGNTPFSEPETAAMRDYIQQVRAAGVNFQSYISLHSYGQYCLLPWGYTTSPPQDYEELKMVADYLAGNISAVSGTQYTTGSSSTALYATDGSSQDWAYGTGIKYAYTLELRDTGSYGFLLPADQIIPTADETWAGVQVVAKYIVGK